MKLLCLGLIVMSVLIIVIGIVKVHELPGQIAQKRGHPQADAIHICSLLGLVIFPFWMFALLWAYVKPVMPLVPLEVVPSAAEGTLPDSTEGEG